MGRAGTAGRISDICGALALCIHTVYLPARLPLVPFDRAQNIPLVKSLIPMKNRLRVWPNLMYRYIG